jgi:hypothetical protein
LTVLVVAPEDDDPEDDELEEDELEEEPESFDEEDDEEVSDEPPDLASLELLSDEVEDEDSFASERLSVR